MRQRSDRQASPGAEARGPIAIGGVGGSGTRLVAQILREAGFYLGADLNRSLDNLWFKLLFGRPAWLPNHLRTNEAALRKGLGIFLRAMTGRFQPSPADLMHVARATCSMAVRGHDISGHGRGWWAVERGRSLLAAPTPPDRAAGWGWKEPSTAFILEPITLHVPGVRYVHVLRNGLDMAFGANQSYPTWGPLFGLRTDAMPGPAASLRFWRLVNERALAIARRWLPERFLLIHYESLCRSSQEEIGRLLRFAGVEPGEGLSALQERLSVLVAPLPATPAATCRDLSAFPEEDLAALQALGYEREPALRRTRVLTHGRRRLKLRLSVALCTYNGARFLDALLDSLAAQAEAPDEVVVSDDGSTDGTVAMLEAFAANAPFPVRISQTRERLGSTKNFERTIGLCEGDAIFLCDQDDVWKPAKLQRSAVLLEAEPACGAVFSDADLIDERSRTTGHGLWDTLGFAGSLRRAFEAGRTLDVLLRGNVVTGATLGFRTRFRDLLRPIPDGWVHDAWIALLIAAVSEIRMLPEPLIRYRVHGSQQIGVPVPLTRAQHLVRWSQFGRRATKKERPALLEQARRFRQAYDRLAGSSERYRADDVGIAELAAKVVHFEARGRMARGSERLRAVMREQRAGRYRRFSNGLPSLAKDLLLLDRLGRVTGEPPAHRAQGISAQSIR